MYSKRSAWKPVKTYWGYIQTIILEQQYVCKRIWMRAGTQSSLEFHANKKETYFIEKGSLIVGLREGRAKNKKILLKKGDTFTIFPGQMHMRIAKEEVIILEVSTEELFNDTYFVEDGKTYTHKTEED